LQAREERDNAQAEADAAAAALAEAQAQLAEAMVNLLPLAGALATMEIRFIFRLKWTLQKPP
jgi:outer membrane protein TolC